MKLTKHSISRPFVLLVSLLFLACPTKAQKEVDAFNVDTTLYSYYQHCQANILRPISLSMADTLFQKASIKNDIRMQAVALSLKLNYYYYQGIEEDSIISYTNKVKKFAKETNQLKYYYFAWGNRLILYYLKTGRNNIALYEAERMLKDAEATGSKIGLLNCYNTLAHIYSIKGFKKLALEWQLKEIELTEHEKVENYNIAIIYNLTASYYIDAKDRKKALEMLQKAEKASNSPGHKALTKLYYVNYYLAFNNITEAEKMMKECQLLFSKDKRLDSAKKTFYQTESKYYIATNQLKKALKSFLNQEAEEKRFSEHALNGTQVRSKADIYYKMGDIESAFKCLQEYIILDDSLKLENEQKATSEFATLLNIEKLNSEKKELMLQTQQKEIKNKKTLIISLTGLLGLVFIFLYRENLLNRKLRLSESKLKTKNDELTESREELRIAKDKAERNSQMKTTFIQSMSHEIRTPLNSIVGFSQILSDNYGKENPETKEFAEIIKTNSNDLLRLITDVLTLSELDQYEEIESNIPTNIYDCCQSGLELAGHQKKEGVQINFHHEKESLIIKSNPGYVTQVLNNLLHNAAKFTLKGSITLEYKISDRKDTISFIITDTGIGISKDKKEYIFERFYKINMFSQGTGLGLPICKSIADKLHGNLIIDDTYINGCRFIFTIPYKK